MPFVVYNLAQNIWNKVKKSSKLGKTRNLSDLFLHTILNKIFETNLILCEIAHYSKSSINFHFQGVLC